MNSAKHILFLTPGFPKDENDFNCIPPLQEFLLKVTSSYNSAKITVIPFQYPYRNKEYVWNGINIFPLNGRNYVIKKPAVWLKGIRKATRIHSANSVDVIHSLWLGECAMIGNFLSKKLKCEHICTLMGQDVKVSNRYLRSSNNEKIKIVALSQNQSDQFSQITNRKADDIIHWGIEEQYFKYAERDIDLLAVGSLIPLKNYSLYIRLIAELKNTHPKLKCKLVGAGPELSTLKALANQLDVLRNIEFTGLLNRKEIFKLMQRSKIFVHPSTFEGSGYAFAEALVNGMNIISFNVGYAQNHLKWYIAKDEDEFIRITKRLLTTELDFSPVNIFPLSETVNKYALLYGIN
jgi:glycosyltransferase involved in cell wall biosynthesis